MLSRSLFFAVFCRFSYFVKTERVRAAFFCPRRRIISARARILKQEVIHMSPKELSYIEDALGHEQHMQTKCSDYANQFQDAELANFVRQLSNKHQQAMAQLFQLVK